MHSQKWRSPSNIALVKYWGKYPQQLPANPSLSFTLSQCYTETEVNLTPKRVAENFSLEILLDNVVRPDFKPKIENFLSRIHEDVAFLQDYHAEIKTYNSFPHSSGIASSASGMSALSLCLLSLKEMLTGQDEENFFRKASQWARLGSGSASRSVYGGLVEWGRFSQIPESSDQFAIPYRGEIHSDFNDFCDYVLLVETGSKAVSSSAGHRLMDNHPFAQSRFLQADQNLGEMLKTLANGDLEHWGQLVEREALSLHAMMMTSTPYFILMKANTVSIIEKIQQYRQETINPVYFTLDAGANVHLLFPRKIEQAVNEFVKNSLTGYLKNEKYICDLVGPGPLKMNT